MSHPFATAVTKPQAEHQTEDDDLRDNLPGSVPLTRLGGSENGELVFETVEVYEKPRDVDTDEPEINQVERKDDQEDNQDEENNQEEETNIQDTSLDNKELRSQILVRERCHHLARSFRERTQRARNKFELPPTPSTISSDPGNEEVNNIHVSPFKKEENMSDTRDWEKCARSEISSCAMVEQQGCIYITWLSVVTISYLYNCFVIPLRTTFPYQTDSNTPTWMILDYSMDVIYFLDLIIIKPRIVYLEDGFWVRDIKRTRRNYLKKAEFKMDVMSLIPLDLLYFYIGYPYPILRITRLLKIHSFREFFNHFDKVLPSPYIVRVARTLTYMVYLVHINACAYFAVSCFEGLGSNKWVYNGKGNAYVRCIYFAVKTATSIGKNPRPENRAEYLFMTACWLMGVFVFAILIGQIRDIIATATRAQTDYRKRVDETLDYLRKLNLPPPLIERVKMWFTYTWQQQHTLDESRLLDHLPNKLKTDVAINVHISTINKVQLFKDCDEALLRELVLKLRPVLYLPGDYICRKGEVGKEMYIVKSGQVQVVSQDGTEVLATLTEGSVFGEISLLSISGCNRRTADVRSNGFSSLFVLNKDDLNEALVFHPNAQEILKRKAKQLMKQNADRERQQHKAEVLIANPETPKLPKLLPIVLKVLPPESGPARLLKYGSRYRRGGKAPNSARPTSSSLEVKEMTRCHSLDLGQLSQRDRETNFIFPPRCSVLVHNEDRYG